MTDSEIERLVAHVGDGKSSILSIRKSFPGLSDPELHTLVFGDTVHIALLRMDNNFDLFEQKAYRFKDTDMVYLSEAGQNILYRIRKEERMMGKQDEAIKWAKRAYYGMIVIGVLSILTGIASMLLPHLLQLLCPQ